MVIFLIPGCLVVSFFASCLCELHLLHRTTGCTFKWLKNNTICQDLTTLSSAGFGQKKSKFCRSVRSFVCKWQLSLAKGCKFIQMLFKLTIQRKHSVLLETRSAAYQTSGALTSFNEGLSQVLLHGNMDSRWLQTFLHTEPLIYNVRFVVETRAAQFQWKKSTTRILNSEVSQWAKFCSLPIRRHENKKRMMTLNEPRN